MFDNKVLEAKNAEIPVVTFDADVATIDNGISQKKEGKILHFGFDYTPT